MADFVCGANDARISTCRGVNFGRDCREPDIVADIRNVVAGDPSPDGKGTLEILRGIEVGHVFALGTRYSQDMNATYLDAQGQSRLIEMGCYGIGITRVVAAAIEQNHDAKGIVWPAAAGAVRRGDRAGGLRPQRGGQGARRPAPRRARGRRGRGAARRPRRASWRDVCRHGVDRHPAPHYDRRPRPQGRQRRIPGAQRGRQRGPAPAAVPGRGRSAPSSGGSFRHDVFRHLGTLRRHGWRGGARAVASLPARAGTQVEERLAPSVVTVLSAAISDRPVPRRLRQRARICGRGWTRCRAGSRRRSPTAARARNSSRPSTTKRRARDSIRSSCSA